MGTLAAAVSNSVTWRFNSELSLSVMQLVATSDTHVIIVCSPNIARQFIAEDAPEISISPEAVISVCAQPELNRLPRVHV
jgi:hypothetical protein